MACVFVPKSLLDETLASASTAGKRLLEPLKTHARESGFPVNILEEQGVWNDAEVHKTEDDLWLCLEGEVKFIYGGELVAPRVAVAADGTQNKNELQAKEIVGGEQVVLHPGDWLYIPAGAPHQHGAEKSARLAIIKIPARHV